MVCAIRTVAVGRGVEWLLLMQPKDRHETMQAEATTTPQEGLTKQLNAPEASQSGRQHGRCLNSPSNVFLCKTCMPTPANLRY